MPFARLSVKILWSVVTKGLRSSNTTMEHMPAIRSEKTGLLCLRMPDLNFSKMQRIIFHSKKNFLRYDFFYIFCIKMQPHKGGIQYFFFLSGCTQAILNQLDKQMVNNELLKTGTKQSPVDSTTFHNNLVAFTCRGLEDTLISDTVSKSSVKVTGERSPSLSWCGFWTWTVDILSSRTLLIPPYH